MDTESMPALMVGLGDLGSRIARQLAAASIPTTGVRRRTEPVAGVTVVSHDVCTPWPRDLMARPPADVVFCLAPPERTDAGYEKAYLEPARAGLHWLQQQAPQAHVWLIASTSVYAQQAGEWVDETAIAAPSRSGAALIRAAEQLWLDSPQPATTLRPAGLYGPGREYLLRQAEQGYRVADAQPIYTNRIHVDDVARAVAHLVQRRRRDGVAEAVFNLADRKPVALQTLLPHLQQQLGVQMTGEARHLRRGSKRISSARLAATGFQWLYPDWTLGYADLIAQRRARQPD
ncbi:NAD(P)H-binding protein [Natronospirillum operosum]|nr:NAD(P)H-binding protein [Natronospirillum operosum]